VISEELAREAEYRTIILLHSPYELVSVPAVFSVEFRKICHVKCESIIELGYELFHPEPETAVGSWNPETWTSEIISTNHYAIWEFAFLHRAQNEAFIITVIQRRGGWQAGKKMTRCHRLFLEIMPQGSEHGAWLQQRYMFNKSKKLPAHEEASEEWMEDAELTSTESCDFKACHVTKVMLHSEKRFYFLLVEIDLVTMVGEQVCVLNVSLDGERSGSTTTTSSPGPEQSFPLRYQAMIEDTSETDSSSE